MAQILRHMIADFINVGTISNKVWAMVGTGFNTMDESPNPQLESVTYVNEKTASPTIKRYERVFPFETELWNDQEAIMKIYNIAKYDKVGSDAICEYLRTEFKSEEDGTPITTIVSATLYKVSVEVADITGEGGEVVKMSGNLNQFGDAVHGTFDLENRTWIDGGVLPAVTIGTLTLTISAGQETGKAKVTVSPAISQNNKYVYKTAAAAISNLPTYNDYVSDGWTIWDGYDEIEVTANNYIAVAEVSSNNLAKAAGSGQYVTE